MDNKRKNPALQQESIGEPAVVIAPRENESLFRWIKSTGRFMTNQSGQFDDNKERNELDDILEQDEEEDSEDSE